VWVAGDLVLRVVTTAPLILASRSPQRVSLLRETGVSFESDPADIDETQYDPSWPAERIARHLAAEKARAVAVRHERAYVLGADTIVVAGDELLGKPADAGDARRMLQTLSGSAHRVITGVCLIAPPLAGVRHETADAVVSVIHMRQLTAGEVEAYVASRQWEGKAGGYGLQDNDPFVTCTDGSATNVIGLPMERVSEMLAEAGFRVQGSGSRVEEGRA
jgi:septum formation protein